MPEPRTHMLYIEKSTTVRSSLSRRWIRTLIQSLTVRSLRGFFSLFGRLAPGGASHVAEALFLRPMRVARPSRERAWLESAEGIDVESFEVATETGPVVAWSWQASGSQRMAPPTVLLVHGWAGRGSQLGALAEPLVREGFRVVAFDAPGHGETARRRGRRRSSLPEMVDGVLGMARHLGPLEGVVAHSAGAGAVTYALRHGLEVRRLVYVAPGVEPSLFTDGLRRFLGIPERVLDRMRRRLEARFGIEWSELRGATYAPRRRESLAVFHDRLDDEVPCWQSRELVEAWPGARLEVVSGLGHRRILRDPRVVDQAVGFLVKEVEEAAA